MEEIRSNFLHIIIVIAIVIVSLFIWPNTSLDMIKNSEGVIVTFDGYKEISVLDNKDYEKAIPADIYIKNTSDSRDSFKLYYKYAKSSTIDYNNICISLDNNIYDLDTLTYYEDSEYYYFLLDDYELDSYDISTFKTRIWTNVSEGNVKSTFVAA